MNAQEIERKELKELNKIEIKKGWEEIILYIKTILIVALITFAITFLLSIIP